MRLRELTIQNFRCYCDPTTIRFTDITTIVGKNDSGKSAILDALDIFFDNKSPDKNDACKRGNAKSVRLRCVFCDLPNEVVLDETAPTTFQDELLVDANGNLVIEKTYNCDLEKPKLTSISLPVIHPMDPRLNDLLSLTVTDLKKRATEIGVDLNGVNKTVKAEIRGAIRAQVGNGALQQDQLDIPTETGDKSNLPTLWKGIRGALPLYALFKSDRQSSDQDAEAQDPLKTAVKQAVDACSERFESIVNDVEAEVRKVADLTCQKLREMDPQLASTLKPQFERPTWANVFKVSITGDEEIPLNKRGSGVRRLVLLNFFRAKAERAKQERGLASTIYAIEEPETSQHPNNQRMLLNALQELATADDQAIITTHTPTLAGYVPASGLRFVSRGADGDRQIVECGDDDAKKTIADSLGVLPDNRVKMFIHVQGIRDADFLKSASRMLITHGTMVPDLEAMESAGEVVFVLTGGAENLQYYVSRFQPLRRPEFHIQDRETPSACQPKNAAIIAAINGQPNCKAVVTSGIEIENYVHHEAVNSCAAAAGLTCAISTPFAADVDVPHIVATELNRSAPSGDRWGSKRAKTWIARDVLAHMTPDMLLASDPNGDLLAWMQHIEVVVNSA